MNTLDELVAAAVDRALAAALPRFAAELAARVTLPQPDPDELLTVEAAAKLCGRSRGALFKLIRRERLPVVRSGRSLRVRRRDVLELGATK